MNSRKIIPVILSIFLLAFSFLKANAQLNSSFNNYSTYIYKQIDTSDFKLDIYQPYNNETKRTCLLYIHGGGFKGGSRNNREINDFCQFFAAQGYVVATMSYPLPFKGRNFDCNISAREKIQTFRRVAIDIHDCLSFLLDHANEIGIDSSKIVISGSSAGAEASLHAAYMPIKGLSTDKYAHFKLAGVISMAGALTDTSWITKENAIPTLLFHGTCDNLVPYATASHHYCDSSAAGYLILHGAYSISQRLKNLGQPFYLYSVCNGAHEWASKPLKINQFEILDWLKTDVEGKAFRQINQVVQSENKDCDYQQYEYCR
jgi:poly(3-hydroxybutyrate) depolymerase